ncbi:hypothetical protein SUGI_0539290 [Cryptomeria japonica]|uniref:disease resistance protein Roq1 n=1 Tax=Cryptomeria japonica TaxID=3369 RepID=UPI002408BE5D|nr:disease resistance protein Roq1 [Cryptomeria japonica]GLJ27489.1 hypothetical protein SUGI_0539290 [Cryptomeria japonica]
MEEFKQYKPQSSQFSIHRKKYDVFLSFRGPDVRKTLVDHLYQSLSTAGVNVFLDSEKLEKGEDIGMNLEQAIQDSTIYIPIFSPDYATSAWCLKEVSLMWKFKFSSTDPILMIPLFYNVEPSDVRYADWRVPYAEAFNKHRTKGRHSKGEIDGWTDALHQVSCLSGWSLEETSFGFEGKLVKQVVKDILRTLDIGVLEVARRPVGLIPRCEEVIQLLKLGNKASDRLTLGIWGIGGLGKTTLSKALYNKIHHLFEASSFVSNVKLQGSIQDLKKLQQQILGDLLKMQRKVNDIDQGKIVMRSHLASLRALVVLDDVDNVRQLDALIGDWFGEGSRIIITTRDKRVLKVRQVDVIYPMRGLELAEGVELFSWHAFLRAHPERRYRETTEKIVKACSGLPLSLEIIGTDLYDRNDIRYWTEALRKLQNVGHNSVFETLKISYDTLASAEKHIFLDIACFFVNLKSSILNQNRVFNMDFYVRFWSVLGCEPVYTILKNLEEKALIVVHEHIYSDAMDEDIDEEDHTNHYFCAFSMHEQIRDMGRQIVLEESKKDPAKRSRVWREEDIRTLMTSTTIRENSSVEGLMWRNRMKLQHIDTSAAMQKLDFLLWWKLEVKTEITSLPTNLKYLVLSDCQIKDYNPQMDGVESGSEDNRSSVLSSVLPKSIAQLMYLRYLDMSGTKQTCLPKEVCELHCLEELYLSRCSLKALPGDFGHLIKLKTLDISNNFLSEFPPSFQHLKALVDLEMAWNELLVKFPALPEGLVSLNARRCSKLQIISLMDHMYSLKTMDLSHCKKLAQILQLDSSYYLRYLNLDGCKQLVKLDGLPRRLASLRISGCSQLQKLSFESYVTLTAQGGSPDMRTSESSDQTQRLCMIGCDKIRLNIYRLLQDLKYLAQLDLSVTPAEELLGETQPLVGQKCFIVPRDASPIVVSGRFIEWENSSVAVLFCFVFDSNENVRLPEMEVVITFNGDDHQRSFSQTFKLPSLRNEDGSGKNILRICVLNGRHPNVGYYGQFFKGGEIIRCSYCVQDRLSQQESPVTLRQVEIFLLSKHATSSNVTQLLKKWKLLSDSDECEGSGRQYRAAADNIERQRLGIPDEKDECFIL